jgi:hypothetical protein
MKINRNYQIMLILYFIVVIFLLIQLYELYGIKNEHFKDTQSVSNNNIQSIILSPYDSDEETPKYFGTFIKNNEGDDIHNSLNLYNTTDLKSGNSWIKAPFKNMELDRNKKVIYTDISFDKSKRMIVIGLYYKNKKPVYNIYRKETEDPNSYWEKIADDINITSICHDIKENDKILGINSKDGQIYYNNGDYVNWIGPINYDGDVPLRKIMYDNDERMIGIHLYNNYIYKKDGPDWKNTVWKKSNNTRVRDLIYNGSQKFIATTNDGIQIQNSSSIASNFIHYTTIPVKDTEISVKDIFKSKLGFEIDNKFIFDPQNYNFNPDDAKMQKDAHEIYDFKKNVLEFCKKRKYLKNKNNNTSNEMDEINIKHHELNELYKQIEDINQNMSK